MILTNKALEDFRTGIVYMINSKYDEKIIDKEGAVEWIEGANDLMLNAHIIEWFDSVGIYIDTESEYIYEHVGFYACVNNENLN